MTEYFNSARNLAQNKIRGIDMMRHSASVQINLDIFGQSQWQYAVKSTLVLIAVTRDLFSNSIFFIDKTNLQKNNLTPLTFE
jgi:gamma-glutamylcysteine synthetase